MGLSYGEQSFCSVPPSPVHPHERAPMRSCSFIFEAKSLICSLVGAFLLLSRGVASFWCQVCFGPSAVVNFHFCVQSRQACSARAILGIFELEIAHSLNFLITMRFKTPFTLYEHLTRFQSETSVSKLLWLKDPLLPIEHCTLRSLGGHFSDVENSAAFVCGKKGTLNNNGRLAPVKTKTTTEAREA